MGWGTLFATRLWPSAVSADRKGVRGSDEGKPGHQGAGEAHRYQEPRQADGEGDGTRAGQTRDQERKGSRTSGEGAGRLYVSAPF